MPGSRSHHSKRLALVYLALASVGAACMVYYHTALFLPRVQQASAAKNLDGGYSFGRDFYPIWLTARVAIHSHRDLYSPEMTREIQIGLFGRPLDAGIPTDPLTDYRTFAYPAFTDLLFWPTASLPFPTVRVLMAALLAALTVTSILFWISALEWHIGAIWIGVVAVLTLGSYPVLEGLHANQLGLAVGFLLAAALLAIRRERYLFAGFLMALTTIKPQMSLLVLLYLLLWCSSGDRKRRLFYAGLVSTIALLSGAALLVWPQWVASWLLVLFAYHRYARPPLVGEVLAAPLGLWAGSAAVLLLVSFLLLALMVIWRGRSNGSDSREFWMIISALLGITSITLLPGQAVHDHVILLPAIFLVAMQWGAMGTDWLSRLLRRIGLAVLVWPYLAACVLLAARPLLTADVFYSKAVFALPLRTAAVFPFVVLGLLMLVWRGSTGMAKEKSAAI